MQTLQLIALFQPARFSLLDFFAQRHAATQQIVHLPLVTVTVYITVSEQLVYVAQFFLQPLQTPLGRSDVHFQGMQTLFVDTRGFAFLRLGLEGDQGRWVSPR